MIKAAKKRGYVTMDELNAVLPSEEVTPEQIEDTMSMLLDMGINVIEDEEAEEAGASGSDDDDSLIVRTVRAANSHSPAVPHLRLPRRKS